jgi:hypothetical protein
MDFRRLHRLVASVGGGVSGSHRLVEETLMKPEGQNFLETLFILAHMNNNQFLTVYPE